MPADPTSTRMLTITPSNCLYLSCLRKYQILAVEKRWPGMRQQSPALRFSTGLHRALRDIYDPRHGTPPHMENMGGYIRAAYLREAYPDADAREHDVCRAARMIADYVDGDDDAPFTLAVEKTGVFRVKSGDLIYELHARLDRALVRPHQPDVLTVRDYKIGRLSLEPEQVVINLAVAKMLWPGFRSYSLEVDGLVDSGIPERLTYHSRECKGIVSGIITPRVRRFTDATEHPGEPGEACMYCSAKQGCPAYNEDAVDAKTLDFDE